MASLTIFPDPNPETSSVDGFVRRQNGVAETFTSIRVGTGLGADDLGDVVRALVWSSTLPAISSITVYPDPDPETTTTDGMCRRSAVDEVFGSLRTNPGTSAFPSTDLARVDITSATTSQQYDGLERFIMLFDTSAISSANSVHSGTISVYGTEKLNGLGTFDAVLDVPTPASNTDVVAADYNIVNWAGVRQANDILYTPWTTAGYNSWTLNATGRGNVSKTGVSKFGYRLSCDFDIVEPTWKNPSAGNNISRIAGNTAEAVGTGNDPKITIDYYLPSSANNQYQSLERAVMLFDTSAIPDSETITSATLSIYGYEKTNNLGSLDIALDKSSPASNTALVGADYNIANWSGVRQANDITYANFTTGAYNDFVLNATGLGNIIKNGVSKFGYRLANDIDNTAPNWVQEVDSRMSAYSAETIGTSQDPKLVVVYGKKHKFFFASNF